MKMEIKDILIFSMCVPACLYSVYEGVQLFGYLGYMKEHNSACVQPNPNRWELFFGTILMLALLSIPIQAAAQSYFERALPEAKFPKGSKERKNKAFMMGERMYRFFLYVSFTLMGLWILK